MAWSTLRTAGVALAAASAALADIPPFRDQKVFGALAENSDLPGFPSQTFHSSNIVAPIFQVNTWKHDEVDDARYIFLGSIYGHMKAGPMIFDSRDLSLVYADQQYDNVYTSNVQMLNGEPHLIFWTGKHQRGHASGHARLYDQNYNLVSAIHAKNLPGNAGVDMHEINLTPDNHALFTSYPKKVRDTRSVGGKIADTIWEGAFQEVDPITNEVYFQWAASEHFAFNLTHAPRKRFVKDGGYDWFHINSVEKTEDGNYLVSSRHLGMLTLIDGTTGKPIWILGGKLNQFKDLSNGRATNFAWQHHARFHANQTQITMFDNHGEITDFCHDKGCKSRGLRLEIDTKAMTARIMNEYFYPEDENVGAMGAYQQLDSGNVLVSFGHVPGFVEYKEDGTPVMDVQRGKLRTGNLADMFSYRIFKHNWVGNPTWPPSVAVNVPGNTTSDATVWVSWNGATEVNQWVVLASDKVEELDNVENIIAESPREGFETTIKLDDFHHRRYLTVAALDINGNLLNTTAIVDMATGKNHLEISGITQLSNEPLSNDTGNQEQHEDQNELQQPPPPNDASNQEQHDDQSDPQQPPPPNDASNQEQHDDQSESQQPPPPVDDSNQDENDQPKEPEQSPAPVDASNQEQAPERPSVDETNETQDDDVAEADSQTSEAETEEVDDQEGDYLGFIDLDEVSLVYALVGVGAGAVIGVAAYFAVSRWRRRVRYEQLPVSDDKLEA
jgi:hypothetical protein